VVGVAVELGHAETGGDFDAGLVAQMHAVVGNLLAQLLDHDQRLLGIDVDQQDEELFAAVAENEITGATARLQRLGDLAQGDVAAGVTVFIVDQFEMINVDHQDAERFVALRGVRDFSFQHGGDELPAQQLGNGVAAAFNLGGFVKQAVEQVGQRADGILELDDRVLGQVAERGGQLRQQDIVNHENSAFDLDQLRRTSKHGFRLV